jgi:hypothetical protein
MVGDVYVCEGMLGAGIKVVSEICFGERPECKKEGKKKKEKRMNQADACNYQVVKLRRFKTGPITNVTLENKFDVFISN